MLINNIYSSKSYSISSVGVDRPEFTPLERGKSLNEGGSPQVGGGHPWDAIFFHCGRRSCFHGREARKVIPFVGGGQEETSGGC